MNNYNNLQDILIKDSNRNAYIKNALKEVLYDVVKNPNKFTLGQLTNIKSRKIVLKNITYILTIAIEEFLSYAKKHENQITSTNNAKSELKVFVNANLTKLKCTPNFFQNADAILDKKLDKIYRKPNKVSDEPVIQFIYWCIKNISRLCIDPKKQVIPYDVADILKNYFDNMFFAIDKYYKNSKEMTSSDVRNFLSSTFIDKILESEYYQKTFE